MSQNMKILATIPRPSPQPAPCQWILRRLHQQTQHTWMIRLVYSYHRYVLFLLFPVLSTTRALQRDASRNALMSRVYTCSISSDRVSSSHTIPNPSSSLPPSALQDSTHKLPKVTPLLHNYSQLISRWIHLLPRLRPNLRRKGASSDSKRNAASAKGVTTEISRVFRRSS